MAEEPAVTDNTRPPSGAIPKWSRFYGVSGFLLGLVVLALIFAGSPLGGRRKQQEIEMQGDGGKQRTVAGLSKLLAEQQQRVNQLEPMIKAQGANLAAAQESGGPVAGYQQQAVQEQRHEVDPLVQAEIDFALEQKRKELRRAFAKSELGTFQGNFRQEPETKSTPVETVSTKVETPKPPEETPKGKPYIVREGTILEAIHMNRLNSTFTGPVAAQLSDDLLSHDRTAILVPKWSRILGYAQAVTTREAPRIAVSFHRIILPNNDAIDLDKFTGLNQIGETGLKDKVNNHYLQIFGASVAIGVIGAAAQGSATYGYGMGGLDAARYGFGSGMSQAAMQVLNRFLNVPPTVTIREGQRCKVWFTQDIEIPVYERRTE